MLDVEIVVNTQKNYIKIRFDIFYLIEKIQNIRNFDKHTYKYLI